MPTYKCWPVPAFKTQLGQTMIATHFDSTIIANSYNAYYGPIQAIWDLFSGLSLGAFDVASVAQLPSDDQEHTLFTLENGVKIFGRHNGDYVGAGYEFTDGTKWYQIGGQNRYDEFKLRQHMYMFIMPAYNGDTPIDNNYMAVIIFTDSSHPDVGFFQAVDFAVTPAVGKDKKYYYDEIIQNAGPLYEFLPVEYLAGNNSQFYMPLSQIREDLIGDGETYESSDDPTTVTLTPQSRFYNMLVNLPQGQETIIAYCGGNYMTATTRYVTGTHDLIYYILKFYFRSGLLIYTTAEMAVNDPPYLSEHYLSFIIDNENEVAALDPVVVHFASGDVPERYGYNENALPSEQDMYELWVWLQDNGQEHETGSPYDTGSTDDGGDANTPRPQDHITDSPLPTTGGLNMGIVTLYVPDDTELAAIGAFLWSDDVLDNFKKYFNNFADNILCLYTLPYKPDSLPSKAFTVGKMTSQEAALAAVDYCTQRFFDIPMGSLQLSSRWGSYLDYSPYTKIEIYLPYCGIHSLDIDEFMSPAKMDGTLPSQQGCTIDLVYRLDIVTGLIVAKVKINGEIRYQFNGKVGANLPLTGVTYSNAVNGIVTAGAGLAATVATGGLTAPMSAAAAVTATVQAQKPDVTTIGNITGDASMLATDVPYLRLSMPNKPLLESQETFTGFPSYKSGTLGQFDGYTEVIEAHVEGIACTDTEREEIIALLKSGVIL